MKKTKYTIVICLPNKTYWINKYGLLTRLFDHKIEYDNWMKCQKLYYKYKHSYPKYTHIIDDAGVIIK